MNQLTTINQFTLEETLMQKVFEAYGYQFTIVTPNDSEPHFIAREVSDALGYSKSFSLSQYFRDKLIITKKELFKKMSKNRINLQVHYIPIHLQPFYKKRFNYKLGDFPVAESFYEREVSLPIYFSLKTKEIYKIINKIKSFF